MSFRVKTRRRLGRGVWAVLVTALFVGPLIFKSLPLEAAEKKPESDREKAMGAYLALEESKKTSNTTTPEQQEVLVTELKALQKELLQFPKKKRFHFTQDMQYTYDSNANRVKIHHEKGDSTFRVNPAAEVDLSGLKTDLRVEYRYNRIYNIKRPENDSYNQETTLRFSRKILPKTTLALNDRLNRSSVRVAGKDNRKVGWDNAHRATLNYELNPKIKLNLESNYTRTDFPHKDYGRTSNLSYSLDPNVSLQVTRKTRFTGGYRWSFTKIPTKSINATTHEVRAGYSGQLTPKSSLSADVSLSRQNPDSAQVGISDTVNSSLGYVWQATPKTSIRALYSNSLSLAVSDSLSGVNLLKSSTRSASDTWSLSVRVRLHRRVTGELSFNPSRSYSKTKQTGAANTHTQTIAFPFQIAFDVNVTKWLKLRLTYTFRHQIGDEPKTDENRAHTWFAGCNTAF